MENKLYTQFKEHLLNSYENYYPNKVFLNEKEDYKTVSETLSNSSGVIFLCDIPSKNYLMVSDNCEHILGLKPIDFIEGGITTGIGLFPSHQVNIIAHDVLPNMFDCFNKYGLENKSKEVRASYTTLVLCGDNVYRWFLHQVTVVETDEKGLPIKALKVLTDIDELKRGSQMDFYLSLRDSNNVYKVISSEQFQPVNPKVILSNREKEVLQLVGQGLTTKQIADLLHISENTVSNHRKNMLQRSKISTTEELIKEAFSCGLIH